MGRKLQGAKLRSKKRSQVEAQHTLEKTGQTAETQEVVNQTNDDLFVLDTTAVVPSKKQLEKKEKNKRKYTNSAKEEAQIKKLVDTHPTEKLEELAKAATAKRAKINKAVDPTFDLWGDEVVGSSQLKKKTNPAIQHGIGSSMAGTKPAHRPNTSFATRALAAPASKRISVDVAESGQSYNPDKVQHQQVIENAFKVEQKRQTAEDLKLAPISKGMSEETKAYLLGDSDTDDDSEPEEENDAAEKTPMEKKKEKMTRAQRNRQKRIRGEQKEILERKRQKKFQNSVGESKTISKKLRKEEAEQREKAETLKKLKEESERTKGKNLYQQLADENPIHAPTYPVALSSELKSGSLRTIRPKGSLVTDRMASFLDRDMAPKKQLKRKQRVQGKLRKSKIKVRGKGFEASKEGHILG
jgi:nucleolar protein 53